MIPVYFKRLLLFAMMLLLVGCQDESSQPAATGGDASSQGSLTGLWVLDLEQMTSEVEAAIAKGVEARQFPDDSGRNAYAGILRRQLENAVKNTSIVGYEFRGDGVYAQFSVIDRLQHVKQYLPKTDKGRWEMSGKQLQLQKTEGAVPELFDLALSGNRLALNTPEGAARGGSPVLLLSRVYKRVPAGDSLARQARPFNLEAIAFGRLPEGFQKMSATGKGPRNSARAQYANPQDMLNGGQIALSVERVGQKQPVEEIVKMKLARLERGQQQSILSGEVSRLIGQEAGVIEGEVTFARANGERKHFFKYYYLPGDAFELLTVTISAQTREKIVELDEYVQTLSL